MLTYNQTYQESKLARKLIEFGMHNPLKDTIKKKDEVLNNMEKKNNMTPQGFDKIESNNSFWNPSVIGEYIEGELQKKVDGDFGTICIIKTHDGEVSTPSHKVLQNRMAKVNIGQIVRIVLTGEELPKIKGHNPTKLYEVYVKR